ncbi:hypothetical protein Tco_1187127, partial [Tanacetum coccineum]
RIPQSHTRRYPVHFEDLSNIRSPRVDGLSVMPEDPYAYVVAPFQAPPSPNYVSGPKEPEQAPPSPVYVPYVPEPVYPEFMPLEDEVFPAEEQPLPAAVSPTADSPGYIADSTPKEDPEEDPTDYPDDKEDDEMMMSVAFPAVDHVLSAEETKPFEIDECAATPPPHLAYRVTARISIRPQTPVSLPSDIKVARLLAIPTPPPSPLSPWSSPLPHIPSPPLPPILSPLPASPPLPVSSPPPLVSRIYPLGYKAVMIRMRAETSSTSHPPPFGIPPSGTPLLLPIPAPTSSPPWKRLCIVVGLKYEVRESSSAAAARPTRGFRADYGFIATIDRDIRRDPEREVGFRIIDTLDEMLKSLPRLNMLDRDRRAHARIALLMEREARMYQEAWGWSMNASDLAHTEVRALRTQVVAQQLEIAAL